MPPTLLTILVLIYWAPAGRADIRPREMYGATGSSVTFPPINITEDTLYDFRKVPHTLIVTYHGIENIRPPYTGRVLFSSRTGEIELRNLTEEDSGQYEQVVNMEVVAAINLLVIEPVNEPTLKKVNETIHGDQCRVVLECSVQNLGSVSVIFLKNGENITENITTIGSSRFCSVDSSDPGSRGSYTCRCFSPLGAKTSSEITVPAPDGICRKVTLDLHYWIIICIIIFIIISIFIGVVLKCQTRGRNSRHNSAESGAATPYEASQSELQSLNTTSPADGGRRREESSCNVSISDEGEPGEFRDVTPEETLQPEGITESSCKASMTDEEEPGDDKTQDNDQEVPPKEDSPNCPDSGQCGEEEASTIDPELG